jgi:hypothetical protein
VHFCCTSPSFTMIAEKQRLTPALRARLFFGEVISLHKDSEAIENQKQMLRSAQHDAMQSGSFSWVVAYAFTKGQG